MHKHLEWLLGLPMSVDDPQIMFALVPLALAQPNHLWNPCYDDPHQNMRCNQCFWKVVTPSKVGKYHQSIGGSGETNGGSQWLSSLQSNKHTHPPYINTHWRWWSWVLVRGVVELEPQCIYEGDDHGKGWVGYPQMMM